MFCLIIFSILSVNFSHVCIICVKIYEKMSSGGLEVSLSIRINKSQFDSTYGYAVCQQIINNFKFTFR